MILTEELNVKKNYDIIVVGGGVSGVAAAVQAAREGKSVLLVEKSQKLGGLATLGLVNLFVPMCNGRGQQIIKGMAEEFFRLAMKYGYDIGLSSDFVDGNIPEEKLKEYAAQGKQPPRYMLKYSAEIFALALTELCVNEGVTIMFDSVLSKPVCTNKMGKIIVKGVVIETKSGREYYTASFFVDATGDCDLLYRAGVPTVERGNYHSYAAMLVTLETCKKALESGNIGDVFDKVTGGRANLYGGGHPKDIPLYYGTASEEVNRYLIKNQLEMLEKIKRLDRRSVCITTLPGMPQFRTTRRIDGACVLRETDAFRHFEDSIAVICDFDRRDYLFEVPFGTMYSLSACNVLTCGRSAAGDGYAWDVLRVIPPAIVTGQAAGFACALSLESRVNDVAHINVSRLQEKMSNANNTIHFDSGNIKTDCKSAHELND